MTATTKINFPATKAYVTALLQECEKQGLTPLSLDPTAESGLHENGGWCFLRFEGTHAEGASLLIPKSKGRIGVLHSHIDLSGFAGHVPLPKKNGRVICHFESDPAKVKAVLKSFLGASKRAIQPASKATPVKPEPTPVIDMWAEEEADSQETVMQTVQVA